MSVDAKKDDNAPLGYLIIFILIGIVYGSYSWLDSHAWIPHRVDAEITAQTSWLVGESKSCATMPLDPSTAISDGVKPGYAYYYVACDNGPTHSIKIIFYGLELQPNETWASWHCTKNDDSFTCKQTGNFAPIWSNDLMSGKPTVSYDLGKTWIKVE